MNMIKDYQECVFCKYYEQDSCKGTEQDRYEGGYNCNNFLNYIILKAYMGSGIDSSEGACLIFAHTAKEAKKVGYNECLRDWDVDFINVKVKKLKQTEFLFSQADTKKLKLSIPHVVDDPITCPKCGLWWDYPLTKDGYCESCQERLDDEDELNKMREYKEIKP